MMQRKLFYAISCIAIGSTLSACKGESSAQPNTNPQSDAPPSVTHVDKSYSLDVKNFTDADWLFEQYFGQYGVPEDLKPSVIDNLKLVANGFALQYARGEDVESDIAMFSSYATLMAMNGSLQFSNDEFYGDNIDFSESAVDVFQNGTEEVLHQGTITPETQALLDEGYEETQAMAKQHLEDVAKYGLPYVVEESDIQYITLDRLMGKNDSGGGTTSASPGSFGDIANASVWWHSDVVWIDASKGYVNHVGLTNVSTSRIGVIDSAPGNPNGGVYYHSTGINRWADDCSGCRRVEHLILSESPLYISQNDPKRSTVMNYASSRIGAPYSYNFADKTSTGSFYCSKLVWQAWKSVGVDLAPGKVGEVSPNDIRYGGYAMRNNAWTR